MADGVGDPENLRGLTYPWVAPETGGTLEVAPGVLWLRLALPMALNHVNVWALADGDGWTVVDTGIQTPATVAHWEQALDGSLGGRPVWRVVCTHMHPDHIGLAGWLCDRFDAPLLMTRLEYVTARMLVADTGPAPASVEIFCRAAGWEAGQIEVNRRRYGQFGRSVAPLPSSFQRLAEGDVLSIDGRAWRVVAGDGHSPEHACLWREEDGVFISGDQILPRISSNVSVWPTEPDADPLGDWLRSIDKLAGLLPDDLLVLPSHGEPFCGVKTRLEQLRRGHDVALRRLERTLARPCRALDVFPALFARPVDDGLLGMATGEAVAHLNYLLRQGRVERRRDADGVDWWRTTDHGADT